MKTKILLPLMALGFSSVASANICDALLESYKNKGKSSFSELTIAEKDRINECTIQYPEATKSSTYKKFQSNENSRNQEIADRERQEQEERERMAKRQETVFDSDEVSQFGIPLIAFELKHMQTNSDIPRPHAKLVEKTDANAFCQLKGYDMATEAIVKAEMKINNRASSISNEAFVISRKWHQISEKFQPYAYDKSEEFDRRDEFQVPHALKFESIRCMKAGDAKDKLKDQKTIVKFRDILGNERVHITDEEERELETTFAKWMKGEADDSKEVYNESRNGCSNGEFLGVDYTKCSYSYNSWSDEDLDDEQQESVEENSSSDFMPHSKLEEVRKRYKSESR
ncbi:hypothetical protein HBN50_09070 [Halobacteriovorax sp. GB3]|uniref:hypothetical protein n=1 Tax=Halobacteriovorax sp. GB3 TaxID=2719615 RepID=UPI00235F85A6|nr:hypothetical protein [Halobacteriovorax sp. GB3]MDD0853248.1 hypothetical protein [Halobacteriovorax sp. GB3]